MLKSNSKLILFMLVLIVGVGISACRLINPLNLSTSPKEEAVVLENISIPGVPPGTISLFAENCSACHGSVGQGTDIAPPLSSEELRARLNDEEIFKTISEGRPGTAMPVWGGRLTEDQINGLVALIRNWDQLDDEQLAEIKDQAKNCGSGMGMHPMMGPMMGGGGCGSGSDGPWWRR